MILTFILSFIHLIQLLIDIGTRPTGDLTKITGPLPDLKDAYPLLTDGAFPIFKSVAFTIVADIIGVNSTMRIVLAGSLYGFVYQPEIYPAFGTTLVSNSIQSLTGSGENDLQELESIYQSTITGYGKYVHKYYSIAAPN
jgi:hypothetical protein